MNQAKPFASRVRFVILAAAVFISGQAMAASGAPGRPNILFIAVDDLRPELGCYGNSLIHSPNIDQLAKKGMVFDRAYCQQAVCSPSRTSLLTGTRPDTTKVWDLTTHFRKALPEVVTLPELFKQQGYFVQGMGKIFHLGLDDPASWSVPSTFPSLSTLYYALPENRTLAANRPGHKGPAFECADVPDNTYYDGKLADMAVQALRECATNQQPFWLGVGFIRPHLPFIAPKKYWDLYDPAKIELAPNPFRPEGAPSYAFPEHYEVRGYAGVPDGHVPDDIARQLRHAYYACVSYSDAQIGKVLNELDRLGLRDNTIVILWGDHGWKLGEHDAWAKHTDVELDTRAPLMISVPGMAHAGEHSKALVEFVDVYPTLAELAGLPLPKNLEGLSFKPLLSDPNLPWKSAAFSQYPRNIGKLPIMGYTMRTDRYRFTRWVHAKDHTQVTAEELYDEQADPQENTNVVNAPKNQELVKKLRQQWQAGWQGVERELSKTPVPAATKD